MYRSCDDSTKDEAKVITAHNRIYDSVALVRYMRFLQPDEWVDEVVVLFERAHEIWRDE